MVWLNTSTKGKKYRDQLLDQAADVYRDVEDRVRESGALDKMTKNKYVGIVKEVVDKYAVDNEMAQSAKNIVVKLVGNQWSSVKKNLKK